MRQYPEALAQSLARLLKADLYTTFITPFYFTVVAAPFGYVLVRTHDFSKSLRLLPHDRLLRLESVLRASPAIVGLSFSLRHIVSQYPAAIMVGEDPISPQIWPLLLHLWATRGRKRDVSLHCYQVDVDSPLLAEKRYYVFELVTKLEDSSNKQMTARHLSQDFITIVTPALRCVQMLDVPRVESHFYLTNNSVYARTKASRLPLAPGVRKRKGKEEKAEELQEEEP